jgi:hypothetical protein
MSLLCDHCARSVDDCVMAKNAALTDYAVLLVLKEHVGYAESVDRVIHQWRQHALPLCNTLAID